MEQAAYSLYADDALFYETIMFAIEQLENEATDTQELKKVLDYLATQDYSGCLNNYQNTVIAMDESILNNGTITIHNQNINMDCKKFVTQSVDHVDDIEPAEIFLNDEITDNLSIPTQQLNALFGYQIIEQEGQNLKKYMQMAKASEALKRLPHHITPTGQDFAYMQQMCLNAQTNSKIQILQKDETRTVCEQTIKYARDLNLVPTSTILCSAGILSMTDKKEAEEGNIFLTTFADQMGGLDENGNPKIELEIQQELVPNFHQVLRTNQTTVSYITPSRLFNCSHYIVSTKSTQCGYCGKSGFIVPHFRE
ncbi:Hypothetical_protein [Hexamita inflata]|uniref:Hypothetical_protein n=1 Tax=Hexamita inflata TaxID=28002 RepID=A0ABP1HZ85_9EUKA